MGPAGEERMSDEPLVGESHPAALRLRERFPEAVRAVQTHAGETTVTVRREDVLAVLAALRDDPALDYAMLVDVTALDMPQEAERFRLNYHLLSLSRKNRLRVRVPLAGDWPSAPTSTGIWPGARWMEREVFDLFGIRFDGHPDLRRILMPEEYKSYPLRKEYPVRGRPEDDYVAPPPTWDTELYGDWLQTEEKLRAAREAKTPGEFPLLGDAATEPPPEAK